jgi:hypothetical protein
MRHAAHFNHNRRDSGDLIRSSNHLIGKMRDFPEINNQFRILE